jgi:hypothetical protein
MVGATRRVARYRAARRAAPTFRNDEEHILKNNTTPTNSVYGAMQDGYVERFDQKISPRPSFPKRGITISPFAKGGILFTDKFLIFFPAFHDDIEDQKHGR